ncbi:hypothetical protein KIH07_06070 [Hydrogenophaga taeniospiralis]|uniref:hypothetical protein n=1 Tax=Hydrogenophaga taeniospiralis TaxID=65656 RepID=UPI001CFA7304|nr:hypothetical protein [Hydrogenophaga taeniospiralis]MCB4363293.1 hypothetical protein [Hydrogenophaga taeniospiralis]
MKATGREVIDVIEKVIDLEWFRYGRAEADGVTTHVPITVWRFKSAGAADEVANRIINALRFVLNAFSGNVHWTLRFSERNWVLLPTQVQELENSGRFRTDGDLMDHLYREDPSLGRKAHEDLAAIADGLARQLRISD